MDYKLMREFEELEGLSDQVEEDTDSIVEEDEDDPSFRPTLAANLNNADIYYEVRIISNRLIHNQENSLELEW
jgi:hypothetical protein